MSETEENNSFWFKFGSLAGAFAAVLIMLLAIYGAKTLFFRSENVHKMRKLNSKIVQQELIIKRLDEKLEISENGTRVARNEAQKLLRAHKWVGIFRTVLPDCFDNDFGEKVEKND